MPGFCRQQQAEFTHRMEVIRLQAEIAGLKGEITKEERERQIRRAYEVEKLVGQVNGTGSSRMRNWRS